MNRDLHKAATDLISGQFAGIDCSNLADEKVVVWIDELYLGGWAKFTTDHTPRATPAPTPPTPLQKIYEVRRLTGVQLRLQMFETVERVTIEDDHIMVLINICETVEHRSQYTVKRRGKRMVKVSRSDRGMGRILDTFEVWDDDSGEVHKRREPETPYETRRREEWELLCYRPGTAKTPLDNYDSVDSDRMAKHWRKS
jgi:hypothetical protein